MKVRILLLGFTDDEVESCRGGLAIVVSKSLSEARMLS